MECNLPYCLIFEAEIVTVASPNSSAFDVHEVRRSPVPEEGSKVVREKDKSPTRSVLGHGNDDVEAGHREKETESRKDHGRFWE